MEGSIGKDTSLFFSNAMRVVKMFYFLSVMIGLFSCTKKQEPVDTFEFRLLQYSLLNTPQTSNSAIIKNAPVTPTFDLEFNDNVDSASATDKITIYGAKGKVTVLISKDKNDSKHLILTIKEPIDYLSKYGVTITKGIQSASGKKTLNDASFSFLTAIPSQNGNPVISDDSLLTVVQRQTFKYFWDAAHPVSGLALERKSDPVTVTSGGSGFGLQAIVVGIHRNFITRQQGLERLTKIVDFLDTKAEKFHGAFSHWLNGSTGKTIPFSQYDDGGDLVETSYLVQGLLTVREYFNQNTSEEIALRQKINTLVDAVEWTWYQQNNQKVLYWHWSPNYGWKMNHKIQGWNEALITYIMAATSTTYPIDKSVYETGWALNGGIKNGNKYYGYELPLGWANGGPLFFSHYSFLGIDPAGLKDQYADYELQTKNHSFVNYNYCVANPKGYWGYGENCWGLTASDTYDGYSAHEPNNDRGVISPTAALSSMPYTPKESMAALRFFYYQLGDKIWRDYGFVDAFSLDRNWFADSFLAIDQGPIVIMLENHRSRLIWSLLSNCPEVKNGMRKLGFTAPYL